MDVYEAIEKRRTIRGFTQGASEEQLRKIILAGTRALSAGNCQPWEFIVLDNAETINQIAEHKYQQNLKVYPQPETLKQKEAYQNCSVVAVCYKEGHGPELSAWMCIQNMALAATAEGLGVLPSTFWGEHQEAVEKLLGLPEDYKLATVMLIGVQEGYAEGKIPPLERRPDFSWLHKNSFGSTL